MDEDTGRARIGIVPLFANNHVRGSIALANKAYKVETELTDLHAGIPYFQHKGYVTGSLLLTVAFLEAAINELIFAWVGRYNPWEEKDRESYQRLSDLAKIPGVQKLNTLDRYQLALSTLGKEQFDNSRNPFQDIQLLIRLRNELVHFRPDPDFVYLSPENDKEEHRHVRALKGKFEQNRVALLMNRTHYPDIILGFGCTKWAILSSLSFVGEFYTRIGQKDTFSELKKELR